MNQTKERLLAGLKEAMLAEQAGVQFYALAARNTLDVQAREVFAVLSGEEGTHLDYLKRQYRHLLDGTGVEADVAGHGAPLAGDSPIFSPALKERIGEAHIEMTALSVGLQLELASVERYHRLADEAGPAELKAFFMALVHWEEGHAAALKRQSRYLLEDYWNEARFAPF